MTAPARPLHRWPTHPPLLLCGAGLALTWALLIAWPMRIWERPLSPTVHLVGTFGIDLSGAIRYAGSVLLLFGWYLVALALVLARTFRPGPRMVFGVAALCCAIVVLTHPLTSEDLFNYIAGARIAWRHGDNPLTVAPVAYPDDRFVQLVRNWREVPSPYGPLWSLLTVLPLAAGLDRFLPTIIAFKALSAGSLLIAGALAWKTAERLRPGWGAAAALALTWNPLAVWHAAGNGHNDAVMAALLCGCCWLLVSGRHNAAAVCFTAAALVKFAPLLLLPLIAVWWVRSGRQPSLGALLPGLAVSVVLAVAAYAPFWAGTDTFRTALDEGSYFTVSTPAAVRGALMHIVSGPTADLLAAWAGRGLFGATCLVVLTRARLGRVDGLLSAASLILLLYLGLAATYFAPWYLLWPLALACALPWRRETLYPTIAASLTGMSILMWAVWARERWGGGTTGDWYPMHLLSAIAILPPVLLGWWWSVVRRSTDVDSPVEHQQVTGAGVER